MKKKILIFEDNENDFYALKERLNAQEDYVVLPDDFKELNNAIIRNKVTDYMSQVLMDNWQDNLALVICDLQVKGKPDEDNFGLNVINHIRNKIDIPKCRIFTKLVPIIVWTGVLDNTLLIKAFRKGANDYAYKPLTTDTQDEGIQRWNILYTKICDKIADFEKNFNIYNPIPSKIREGYYKLINEYKTENRWKKMAFLMSSFRDEHLEIANKIKEILEEKHKIKAYIATDIGKNDEYIWQNVQVYMHASDFGIGIYADDAFTKMGDVYKDKVGNDKFRKIIKLNSNLAQEVGYMFGLNKKVCLLKDDSIQSLNSDNDGRIYVKYSSSTIEDKLSEWLKDKGFIS